MATTMNLKLDTHRAHTRAAAAPSSRPDADAHRLRLAEADAAALNEQSLQRIRRAKQRIASGFYDRMLSENLPADSAEAASFSTFLERVREQVSEPATRSLDPVTAVGDRGVFTRRVFGVSA